MKSRLNFTPRRKNRALVLTLENDPAIVERFVFHAKEGPDWDLFRGLYDEKPNGAARRGRLRWRPMTITLDVIRKGRSGPAGRQLGRGPQHLRAGRRRVRARVLFHPPG